jgi:hypothetical protein
VRFEAFPMDPIQRPARCEHGGLGSTSPISISSVPALPGEVRPMDRMERARWLTQQWALQQLPLAGQAIPNRLAQQLSVTVGVRGAVITSSFKVDEGGTSDVGGVCR